ncbi:hypothetical protein KQW07_10455 [Pseudomonas aeruginosa]|uniref:hypothetical protein n=1 Tax=Pseudomonas aeruginosa TaxID=287 RepID=UPI001C1DEC00|nr:hypothetical protein [Pseudomonas aeruginosa]MBU5934826.1 hypothetical protein [Pseudomonas aeruginosa]
MQVQTPEVSGTKATTARTRPTMASQRLDLPSICGTARSTRKHAACSRIRQQLKRDEWATYMANLTTKKAQGGRRYAR